MDNKIASQENLALIYAFIQKTYATKTDIANNQDKLVSGVNIKTLNGNSIIGSGNLNLTADECNNAINLGGISSDKYALKTDIVSSSVESRRIFYAVCNTTASDSYKVLTIDDNPDMKISDLKIGDIICTKFTYKSTATSEHSIKINSDTYSYYVRDANDGYRGIAYGTGSGTISSRIYSTNIFMSGILYRFMWNGSYFILLDDIVRMRGSSTSYYKIHANGFIEQYVYATGGKTYSSPTTVTLPYSMSSSIYSWQISPLADGTSFSDSNNVWCKICNRTSTGFKLLTGYGASTQNTSYGYPVSIYICGF